MIRKIFVLFLTLGLISISVGDAEAVTYGSNFLTGGTPTHSSAYLGLYTSNLVFDGNVNTGWYTQEIPDGATNPWVKYDLGAGITKVMNKLTYYQWHHTGDGKGITTFKVWGSNNDSTWDVILNTTADPQTQAYHDFYPTSTTAYRYFRFTVISSSLYNIGTLDEWLGYEAIVTSSGPTRKIKGMGISR